MAHNMNVSPAIRSCASGLPPGECVIANEGYRQIAALQALIDRQRAEHVQIEAHAIGPSERFACDYVAELCEGIMLIEGVSRLPRLGYMVMLTHAVASEYAAMPEGDRG